MDFTICVFIYLIGMINGLVEVLWKKKDADRRYHDNTFVTTVDSLIDCAMTSVNDCKDCQYISFEEESESSKCFGYKSVTPSTASSYDVIPGAVIYGKLQTLSKEDRCVGAGYDYVGAVDLCYLFIFRQMTFEDAVTECGTAGNRLIVLDTGSKLELIRTIIHSTEGYEIRIYWVDGNDKETEGTWLFSTGVGIPMNSTFWMTDEPNHGIIENCVCLYLGSHKFHDVSCNGLFYPICEMV